MKRNRYLSRLLSHRYLFQLAGTCVVFLLLPCLLTLFSAIHQSYRALADTTAEFYLHTTESFASYFRSELGVLRNHALQFSTDSRNPPKKAAILNQAILQTNPYYYNEVIALVKEYSTSNPFFWESI